MFRPNNLIHRKYIIQEGKLCSSNFMVFNKKSLVTVLAFQYLSLTLLFCFLVPSVIFK